MWRFVEMRWFAWFHRSESASCRAPSVGARARSSWRDGGPAGDCEAFVVGHLAEYRIDRNQCVSVWEWTNLLAHGSEHELREDLADAGRDQFSSGPFAGDVEWCSARSLLAGEVLHLAAIGGSLESLQRSVIVPLELELAANPETSRWQPRQWAASVEAALDRHRRELHRAEANPPGASGRQGSQKGGNGTG